ncbi:MAG: hypothetical protein AAFU77_17095, partial [Myxococcota bacterium]
RARNSQKNKPTTVDILRDDSFLSRNAPTFKRMRRAPKGYPVAAKLSFDVPDGSHTYQITAALEDGAVLARQVDSVETAFAASAEANVGGAEEQMAEGKSLEEAAGGGELLAATQVPSEVDAEAIMESSERAAENVGSSFAPSVRKALRIAVYDFELAGIEGPIGAVVTDSTLSEVRKLSGISAIGMDEIRDMLSHEANKQILGCEDNSECLAEIAGALGVDQLVTGKLSKVDDGTAIVMRRIDQNRATVIDTFEQRLTEGSGEEFLASVGPGIEKLFPDYELRDGTERGVPKEMALRLNPPPVPTWGFYSVAGAALASAAVAGGFGLAARDAQGDFDQALANSSVENPASGPDVVALEDDFERNRDLSNVFWVTTGVFAVAAGVIYFFTDWDGYQEAAERLEANP